ncbi:AAA family ATPase [Amycolatopsis jiangsuensis]|uniref:Putative ATPase n=1 Tax=Amycolatopsis jiangsuensis TaxID=1181879 RepID=A0A840IWL5_9PSEU|nr:AAA family ATPase [Amycolatopsis jiangsuensis]MBB4687151.1 putative ATPase [Amycolatopsis jiangsuensis]
MAWQPLKKVEIEGFTSIRSATVELGRLNILVGANGAGKSNFVQALELLGRIVSGELGLFVGLNGGASALLSDQDSAARIRLQLDADPNSYEATLLPGAEDELVFEREATFYHGEGHDRPFEEVLGTGHRESRLRARAQERPHRIASYVVDLLDGCKVYHFHDTSADAPVKRLGPTADNLALARDAGNLAAYLLRLKESDDTGEQASYRRIVGAIKLVAPFFRDFVLVPEKSDRVRLRWRQQDSDSIFSANQMSDGTLRFVCLATLLLQPDLPALVVLDEPELGLHPFAIVQLAGLLRQAAMRSQVLIATQSVTLMNQFEVDELIVVERRAGASEFTRPDTDALSAWLAEYSLGELWEKNLLGGRPVHEGVGDA